MKYVTTNNVAHLAKGQHLLSLNSAHRVRTNILKDLILAEFSAQPTIDPEAGMPFDFVPHAPGVLYWWNWDGSFASIEVVKISARTRLQDLYRGKSATQPYHHLFGFCITDSPEQVHADLVREHQATYKRHPTYMAA